MFLILAVWQDWKWKSISARFLLAAGIMGIGFCMVQKRDILQTAGSVGVGITLLVLNKWTEGGIGEGDGWFFVVSGLFLDWQDNMQLFLSGLLLCFGVSLFIIILRGVRQRRKGVTLPFLPFLLPMGVEMILDFTRLLQ